MIRTDAAELNPLDLVRYIGARRRFVAIACGSALLTAGLVSLVLPKKFTATASIVIEPPAGMDPRGATALSPVYLDSLKTYEAMVSSDTLFLTALDRLGIKKRFPASSLESLKRSILRVSRPVNTRVIEISATLDDPGAAQQLASWIATEAAALNRRIDQRSADEAAGDAQASFLHAEERLAKQRAAFDSFVSESAGLEAEVSNYAELSYNIDRARGQLRADLAGIQTADETARPRLAEMDRQSKDLGEKLTSAANRLDGFRRKREALEADLKDARAGYEAASVKIDDLRASAGFRGERLEVLDPGIVPQRPSSPNLPLNVMVAFLVSAIGSLCWLSLRFGFERAHAVRESARGHW